MTNRASTLHLVTLSALVAGIAGFVGVGCLLCDFDPQPSAPIELNVDVDLHAIVTLFDWEGNREYEQLAVGDDGTIVIWGYDYSRRKTHRFVEVSDLGEVDLRAAWYDISNDYASIDYAYLGPSSGWWVVGDAGTIAHSDDLGATWNTIAVPGIDADLHAITGFQRRPVIVGDDVVLVSLEDGTWSEQPPPPGGWGSLRGVSSDNKLIVAVGLGGVVWSSTDPRDEWVAAPVECEVDLFDVDVRISVSIEDHEKVGSSVVVVGASGTMFVFDWSGWHRRNPHTSADLIDVDSACMLGADGSVHTFGVDLQPVELESIPGSEAISCGWSGRAIVGEAGLAMAAPFDGC